MISKNHKAEWLRTSVTQMYTGDIDPFVKVLIGSFQSFHFDLLFRSEEPEEKKAHTEDTTSSSTQMIDGDLQANQAAYNYSAWYQVSSHYHN